MVALLAVDGAAHGIAHQAAFHGLGLDAGMQLQRRIDGLLGGPVGDQLDAAEQPAPADIADMAVVAQPFGQRLVQQIAHGAHIGQQVVLGDLVLHRQRRRAGRGVAGIGVAMLKEAGAVTDGIENPARDHGGPDRLVTRAQPLGDGLDIGRDAFLLNGMEGAGSAHAAHHLVEDQQHAVLVADLADAAEIALGRRHRAQGRADHRLGDEGHDRVLAQFEDFGLQLVGRAQPIVSLALALLGPAIGEAGRDVMGLDQQRLELLAAPQIAAGGQRAQGVAVIALQPGDDVAALGLADLDVILARQLERRLHRLGPARGEVDPLDPRRRIGRQPVGQGLHRIVGEEAGMGEGDGVDLGLDGLDYPGVAVAQAGHRRPARGVDIALARAIHDEHPVALDGDRIGAPRIAVKDMIHDVNTGAATDAPPPLIEPVVIMARQGGEVQWSESNGVDLSSSGGLATDRKTRRQASRGPESARLVKKAQTGCSYRNARVMK